jgi:hypothetical protein
MNKKYIITDVSKEIFGVKIFQIKALISFGSIKYTVAGQAGKNILDFAPNNWTITDGGI